MEELERKGKGKKRCLGQTRESNPRDLALLDINVKHHITLICFARPVQTRPYESHPRDGRLMGVERLIRYIWRGRAEVILF